MAVLKGMVMESFIRTLHEQGVPDRAIEDGAMTRLRPVMMTAFTASLGLVPMAISTGTGRKCSARWQPS